MVEYVILDLEEQLMSMKKKQQKQRDNLRTFFISHKPCPEANSIISISPASCGENSLQECQKHDTVEFKEKLITVLQKKLWF